jgi:hypothetical protein
MAANDILREAAKLHIVSASLHALAEENAPLANALSKLAESVRQSATLLEVLVAVKLDPDTDVEKPSN